MDTEKIDDCYLEGMEICDLLVILNAYIGIYRDEIPVLSKLSTLTDIIYAKIDKLTDNLDNIASEENYQKYMRLKSLGGTSDTLSL